MIDIKKYMEYYNKSDKFAMSNGMKLVELGEGYSKFELTIGENSMNCMGMMHGGLLSTMADVAAGTSVIFQGKHLVTLSAHTDYIKPALSGKVIAVSKAIKVGKTICRCEVEISDEHGKLYCKSYITMYITDNDIILDENLLAEDAS